MNGPAPPRLFLVDDHPLVRAALAQLLAGAGFAPAGQAGTPAEALAHPALAASRLAVVNLALGEEGDIDLIRKLRARDSVGCDARLFGIVREAEKVTDRLEREAEVPCVADERKPFQRLASVEPLVAGAAPGLGQKPDLFVVADGRNLHSGLRPEFSDGQHQIPLEAIVARDISFPTR